MPLKIFSEAKSSELIIWRKLMKKSFIERLTDEQVVTFLERTYPDRGKYSYEFSRNESSIWVRVNNNFCDFLFSFSLYEYEVWGNGHTLWIQYLYEVFGEEYKQAYLEHCAKIFN